MSVQAKKTVNNLLRKTRIRATVRGTTERPRLSVTISNQNVSAQIIDDSAMRTLVGSTTANNTTAPKTTISDKAAWVGSDVAKKAKKAGVTKVVFDRNGRRYAGRLSALAEAARKEGLEF